MNAYYLHKPDGTQTDFSACGVCGKLARGVTNFDISERCCTCYDCGLPLNEHERQYANTKLYHVACDDKRRRLNEQKRMDNAALVADYDGPVFLDGVGHGSYGDGFFADVDELAEHLDFGDSEGDRPQFAFCCTSRGLCFHLDNILESATEDMHEDARDDLEGVEALQTAVDAFIEANKSLLTWDVDYKRKVAIPEPAQ